MLYNAVLSAQPRINRQAWFGTFILAIKQTVPCNAHNVCIQVLEFQIRKEMTLEMWTDRQDKIQTFFGPGVQAEIQKTEKVAYCLLSYVYTDMFSACRKTFAACSLWKAVAAFDQSRNVANQNNDIAICCNIFFAVTPLPTQSVSRHALLPCVCVMYESSQTATSHDKCSIWYES